MDKLQFEALTKKLDIISRLLMHNLLRDMKTQKEKIITLSSLGFRPFEIAEMLGTTMNTVNVTLSRHRTKRKTQSKKLEG